MPSCDEASPHTFSRMIARGLRSPMPAMTSVNPKKAFDSRPSIRPLRLPASERSVQGLDAHAMSAPGTVSGSTSNTFLHSRSETPH